MATTREPAIGVVQKVFVHDSEDDFSNHEANVRLVNNEEELRRIPIHVERNGHAVVPKQNDAVEVNFLGSEGQSGYVADFVYTADDRAPLARSGHYRQRFGESSPYLFIEAEPIDHSGGTPDVVRLAKKPDGLSDPSTEVAIDDSSSDTEVSVQTDGNVTIDVSGDIDINADGTITISGTTDVTIDEGGSTKSVLTEDAVFEYEQRVDTSDGTGGTTTKETTTVSNNETTDVEIE